MQNTCFIRTPDSCVQGAWISVQGACFPVQIPVQNTYFWGFRGYPFLEHLNVKMTKNHQNFINIYEKPWGVPFYALMPMHPGRSVLNMMAQRGECLQAAGVLACRGLLMARQLPSRQWSCSELEKSHKNMLKVKRESEDKEELERKIQEILAVTYCYNMVLIPIDEHSVHLIPMAGDLTGLALFAKEYEKEIRALRSQAEEVEDSLWHLNRIMLLAGSIHQETYILTGLL